uniref:Uncharacterized protein n=1 Tax=Arundo donax TaxID=35708 RepID=A0A0A9CHJ0_ARUDO
MALFSDTHLSDRISSLGQSFPIVKRKKQDI